MTPIKNAFPPRTARGRGMVATITDHGKSAGKQRYGFSLDGKNNRHVFNTHPELFSSPGALRKHLESVRDTIDKVLDNKSGTVVHVETSGAPAPAAAQPKAAKAGKVGRPPKA